MLQLAKQESERLESDDIKPEHILIGIIKGNVNASDFLDAAGVTLADLRWFCAKKWPEKTIRGQRIYAPLQNVLTSIFESQTKEPPFGP